MRKFRWKPRSRFSLNIPLLAEEGWTRHEENVPLPIWRGRGGQFGEIFRPEPFAKLLLRLRPIGLALRVGLALRATPSAALRWLRDFLLMPQPPLLCEEGNDDWVKISSDFKLPPFSIRQVMLMPS